MAPCVDVCVGVTALVPVCDGDGDCVIDLVTVGVIALVLVCDGDGDCVIDLVRVGVTPLVPVCVCVVVCVAV